MEPSAWIILHNESLDLRCGQEDSEVRSPAKITGR